MSSLNANIPYINCYVRESFLYQNNQDSLREVYIFGVKAQMNRPLLFHCQLDNGAVWWSLPISAFVHKKDFERMGDTELERLQNLEVWDCESNDIAVTTFSYLQHKKVEIRTVQKQWYLGTYLFTIDNYDGDLNSLDVGYANDTDAKCFHIIQLDNGNYAAYPNNMLRWHNPNHAIPFDKENPPKYKPRQDIICCEQRDKYSAGKDSLYHYSFDRTC